MSNGTSTGLTKIQIILSITLTSILILTAITTGMVQMKAYADDTYSKKAETTQEIVTTVTWVVQTARIEEQIVEVSEDITIHSFKMRNLPGNDRAKSVEAFELSQAEKKKTRLETKLGQLNNSKPIGVN